MFMGVGRQAVEGAVDTGHCIDHAAHGAAGRVGQLVAAPGRLHRLVDHALDLGRGLGHPLREHAHLGRHHREAATVRARARRLDRCVQRQQVGLEGNAVDHADDVGDAPRTGVDGLHLGRHLADDAAHFARQVGGRLGGAAGGHRRVGAVLDDDGDLLERHRGFAQLPARALRALGQALAAVLQGAGRRGRGLGRAAHLLQRLRHAVLDVLQALASGGFGAQHVQVEPDAARTAHRQDQEFDVEQGLGLVRGSARRPADEGRLQQQEDRQPHQARTGRDGGQPQRRQRQRHAVQRNQPPPLVQRQLHQHQRQQQKAHRPLRQCADHRHRSGRQQRRQTIGTDAAAAMAQAQHGRGHQRRRGERPPGRLDHHHACQQHGQLGQHHQIKSARTRGRRSLHGH